MKRFFLIIPLLIVFAWTPVHAQDDGLQAQMEKLTVEAAKAYVNPIVSGFGTDLNSGWFHRAPWAEMFGFDLEFGAVVMATFFQDENRNFTTSGAFRFSAAEAAQLAAQSGQPAGFWPAIEAAILSQEFQVFFGGPSVIGKKADSVRINFPGAQVSVPSLGTVTLPSYSFAPGATGLLEEAPALPLIAPQITIGTIAGSQFTFRYLPTVDLENIGKFKYFGFGIQHNPLVWFGEDALPFEIALGYFTQTMKVGSLMDTKATAFGVNASARLGWGFLNLTPYVGFMKEKSTINFGYHFVYDTPTATGVEQDIAFELESANTSRVTFGVSIKVLIINVNADINLGKYRAFSAGVMIII